MRVLHCPEIVAGNPQALARAEREVGLDSWAVSFHESAVGVASDEILWKDEDNVQKREMKRWRLLLRAIRDFDVTHFNFGRSILDRIVLNPRVHSLPVQLYSRFFELRDLPLLKWCGKGIFITFQGDDVRQGDYCASHFAISPAGEVEPGYYTARSDEQKRERVKKFARYSDRIFALNPDLLNVLPPSARFLPYSHIDPREWRPSESSGPNEVPVVVHAPTHRGVKGTRFILDAIARLKAEGVPLEFVLVEGLTHHLARQVYRRADLLVDQLLVGWYGGVAVEQMALGKPVICYIRDSDLHFIPRQMQEELPIINATPSSIYSVLKEWLTVRKSELPEIGKRSRAYVERWHDPVKIATRLKSEYEAAIAGKRVV